MRIRHYHPADEPALYEICLRTGAYGGDATGLYADRRLLGHVYVGPYLALAPELAFVLDDRPPETPDRTGDAGTPLGYVLGALDTAAFEAECERSWWPPLRDRYPDPAGVPELELTADQRIAALIHHPRHSTPEVARRYPSHLHIDLLPVAQGQGHGRALLERLFRALAAAGSPGVHLGVAAANPNAVGFYRRIGLTEVERSASGFTMATAL